MPFINVSGYRIVLPDFSYSNIYWNFLSSYVIDNYGKNEIVDSSLVQRILKECFQLLTSEFEKIIKQQDRASFFLTVHNYHENSVQIYLRQLKGESFTFQSSGFAASRRVLKLILEQTCKNSLLGTPNFAVEIAQKQREYDKIIEELLYVGYWSIGLADYIATSQIFPKSIGLQIKNETLEVLTYPPYNAFIDFFHEDISNHDNDVVIHNTINDLKILFHDDLGLDYDILTSIIPADVNSAENRYALIRCDDFLNQLVSKYNYNRDCLSDFFSGLTISVDNVLSIEDCILRNQHENRIIYRPIVQLEVDAEKYWVIGSGKWSESLVTLTTNSLPFGKCPHEWLKHKPIKKFLINVTNYHDKVLENPIEKILVEHGIKYDRNLKTFQKSKTEYIRIDSEGIGEIDFIFIDEEYKIIYVTECKHNRSRFDMFNWRRDYENFKISYEPQLEKKVTWCQKNIDIINYHFSKKYNDPDLNIKSFLIYGIFVINAPTVYMLNGKFRAFTLRNLKDLLDRKFVDRKFLYEYENGKEVLITHPYFDNLRRFNLNHLAYQLSKLTRAESKELKQLFQELLEY